MSLSSSEMVMMVCVLNVLPEVGQSLVSMSVFYHRKLDEHHPVDKPALGALGEQEEIVHL